MRGRLGLAAVALVALLAAGGAVSIVHAQTDDEEVSGSDKSRAVDFSGPCQLWATLSNGTVIIPSSSGGVYTVPHKGSASYIGSITQPEIPRDHNGNVKVSTPPGVPSINLRDPWKEDDAETVDANGSVSWDIPDWVPGGVVITVSGVHNDGSLVCKGSITVKLDGGITDSPIGIGAIVLMVLSAVGMVWSWLPKGV